MKKYEAKNNETFIYAKNNLGEIVKLTLGEHGNHYDRREYTTKFNSIKTVFLQTDYDKFSLTGDFSDYDIVEYFTKETNPEYFL